MNNMFFPIILAAFLSGGFCGLIGYYIQRFHIVTLSFSIAHAALAGASLALILGLDIIYVALIFSLLFSIAIGLFYSRIKYGWELISMIFFSIFNSIALLMLYISNIYVLSTASLSVVLWGSLLAVTPSKLILLSGVIVLFIIYLSIYRSQIDAIIFDRKIADAEGINVSLHILILLSFTGVAIAFTLKITGGFLVFSLLYNPVASAIQISKNARNQLLMSIFYGSISSLIGLALSYYFDLPVGATIALFSSLILLISYLFRFFFDKILIKRIIGS